MYRDKHDAGVTWKEKTRESGDKDGNVVSFDMSASSIFSVCVCVCEQEVLSHGRFICFSICHRSKYSQKR